MFHTRVYEVVTVGQILITLASVCVVEFQG